ncbi:hypothetical protein FRB94_007736 [Tulasnella sp. JGI-2019a]|nr:hypothetical protein FRB93_011167 [Tulasnella sp. JGI-2019a]KAG9011746.1 hypothetical protein FRB94_007736 [Tulasnella sp. JGI-2019a]KAG9037006.1 hypothetical protein FRB95_007301 [Tulasnella sp. JGI-2019a]
MKFPVLSEVLVDAVLALTALLAESGFMSHHPTTTSTSPSGQRTRRLGLRRRDLHAGNHHTIRTTGTTPAPDFRYENALTRRADQSVLSMKKKCQIKPAPTGTGSGTNTTTPGLEGPEGGLITVQSPKCGPNGAVSQVNVAAGPNGNIKWIDCGISSTNSSGDKGWTPPTVRIQEMVYMNLSTALNQSTTVFSACDQYLANFTSVSAAKGIPAIMMASFAMQESGCNPKATGQGGEVGMFQLSPDKCTGVSDCFDAATNMNIAADYIQSQLDSVNGNVFLMIGNYNGWVEGMTFETATAAANTTCCHCQNNLDYVHQVVNGWYQNLDSTMYGADGKKLSSATSLGTFNNLNVCDANPGDSAIGRKRSYTIPRRRRDMNSKGWRF